MCVQVYVCVCVCVRHVRCICVCVGKVHDPLMIQHESSRGCAYRCSWCTWELWSHHRLGEHLRHHGSSSSTHRGLCGDEGKGAGVSVRH